MAYELVELGLVLPTLEAAADIWVHHVDQSYLRYFIGEVLEVAEGPYGGAFASITLRLLRASKFRRGMTNATDEFVRGCAEQQARGTLLPPLGREEAATLEEMLPPTHHRK